MGPDATKKVLMRVDSARELFVPAAIAYGTIYLVVLKNDSTPWAFGFFAIFVVLLMLPDVLRWSGLKIERDMVRVCDGVLTILVSSVLFPQRRIIDLREVQDIKVIKAAIGYSIIFETMSNKIRINTSRALGLAYNRSAEMKLIDTLTSLLQGAECRGDVFRD